MSKEEKKDRLQGILADIAAGTEKHKKSDSKENQGSAVSQSITSGSNNIQISGNNNTVRNR